MSQRMPFQEVLSSLPIRYGEMISREEVSNRSDMASLVVAPGYPKYSRKGRPDAGHPVRA